MPVISPPRIVTVDLAAQLGISRSRVRTELSRGTWRRLATGVVLTRPDAPMREDWAALGLALAAPGGAVSGWDAVHARGFGARQPPSARVLVVSPSAMNRVVGQVHVRRTARPFVSRRQPVDAPFELQPLVDLPRAVADTALQYKQDRRSVVALVTSVVQRQACTVPQLVNEYQAGPRRDSAGLRYALSVAADGARSVAEADAARRLARAAVPAFELNVPVVDEYGRVLYVVDALWRELRAALEIDSREYHADVGDWERTLARHNDLTRWGLAVLHYPPSLVTRRGGPFVSDVAQWLARRAAEIGAAPCRARGVRRPPEGRGPDPFVVRP